jgi:ribosomal protein S18 acetylase RimI-like enzyme
MIMKPAFSMDKLIDNEIHFPKDFADSIVKSYGIFYYNTDNPYSWDSNHAIITDLNSDLDKAFQEILIFYHKTNITPRIFASMQARELDILQPYFDKYQFQLAYKNLNRYFLWQNPSQAGVVPGISFQRVNKLDDQVIGIIFSDEDGGEWTVKVIERHLKLPAFHLLSGYVEGIPVTIASLKFMDNYSRVDDVITHLKYRGKGYGRSLMHYLVNYHNQLSDNYLYLYASNPVAIKNYQLCGFVDLDFKFDDWQVIV